MAGTNQSFSLRQSTYYGYALFCYATSVASLVYFILFVNDLLLPATVNVPSSNSSILKALSVNLFALSLFGIQHTVMARKPFKKALNRFINPDLERSTYCLATAIVLSIMCWIWIPFGGAVWSVDTPWLVLLLRIIAGAGWVILLSATFMLDHFELFGLKQGFRPMLGGEIDGHKFKEPGLYRFVRHPIQTGVLIGVWFVPLSTASHFLMAIGMTIYIIIGLYYEERDLLSDFGSQYADYSRRVKRLIPFVY